jgi:hypothetical protein
MDSSSDSATPAQGTDAKGREIVLTPGLPPLRSAAEEIEAAGNDPPPDWILEGLFEAGDKVLLIAPSKTGKTWAALAVAEHLAAGRDFWGFHVARPLRVLYVNLEVTDRWMRRRLRGSLAVAGIEAGAGLRFMHARGKGQAVRDAIEQNPAAFALFDLVILDPFYKLARADEDENSARDIKGILDAVDKLAAAGPAVLTVKHDGKGDVGSKRKTDRGAGSYAAAADYDAALILTPHADGKPRVVVSTVARNGVGRDDFVIRLESTPNGCAFVLDEEAAPEVETDATRKAAAGGGGRNIRLPASIYRDAAKTALLQFPGGLSTGALKSKLLDATGASDGTLKNRIAEMVADGFLKTERRGKETIHRLANPNAITADEEANALADKEGA